MSEEEDRTDYSKMKAPKITQPMHTIIEALVYIDDPDDLRAIISLIADKFEEDHKFGKDAERLRRFISGE